MVNGSARHSASSSVGGALAEDERAEHVAHRHRRRVLHVTAPAFVLGAVEPSVTERHPAVAVAVADDAPAVVPGVVKRLGRGGAGRGPVESHVAGGERVLQEVIGERALLKRELKLPNRLQPPVRPRAGQRLVDRLGVVVRPRLRRHRVEVGAVLQRQQVVAPVALEPPRAGLRHELGRIAEEVARDRRRVAVDVGRRRDVAAARDLQACGDARRGRLHRRRRGGKVRARLRVRLAPDLLVLRRPPARRRRRYQRHDHSDEDRPDAERRHSSQELCRTGGCGAPGRRLRRRPTTWYLLLPPPARVSSRACAPARRGSPA